MPRRQEPFFGFTCFIWLWFAYILTITKPSLLSVGFSNYDYPPADVVINWLLTLWWAAPCWTCVWLANAGAWADSSTSEKPTVIDGPQFGNTLHWGGDCGGGGGNRQGEDRSSHRGIWLPSLPHPALTQATATQICSISGLIFRFGLAIL